MSHTKIDKSVIGCNWTKVDSLLRDKLIISADIRYSKCRYYSTTW